VSRGPKPLRAQEESLSLAERRGLVMRYQQRRGNICDFSIMSPGLVCFVCAMRLVKLSSTPEDILHDSAPAIGDLRFIASSPAISRELWLRTPRGAWRFFRVLDDSILELDCYGMPLVNGTGPVKNLLPAAGAGMPGTPGPAQRNDKKTAGNRRPAAGKKPEPEKDAEIVTVPEKNPVPGKDLHVSGDAPETPSPETIPGLIRKFLKRKKKGLDEDPGSV
jgi:hypothetical protein